MPNFCATTPERIVFPARPLELDLDIDAGGEVELHQRVHRLRRRIDDVQEALVGAHLELLAAFLVDVWRTVHREFLDLGRQRDRTTHLRARALGGVDDLAGRRIENAVIERLEPDPDILAVHELLLRQGGRGSRAPKPRSHYSMMLARTPAPTVRPPSRMAKRSFSSMAIGTINVTSMAMLSPGITISVPAGKVTTPVTSVVRK